MCELVTEKGVEILKPEQLLERGCFRNSVIIEAHDPGDIYEPMSDQRTFDPQEIEEANNQGNEEKKISSVFLKNWNKRNIK